MLKIEKIEMSSDFETISVRTDEDAEVTFKSESIVSIRISLGTDLTAPFLTAVEISTHTFLLEGSLLDSEGLSEFIKRFCEYRLVKPIAIK